MKRAAQTALAAVWIAIAGLSLPVALADGIPVDTADYVFTGQNEPDPAVWARQQVGAVQTSLAPGLGFGIADPDSASLLLYSHASVSMAGNSATVWAQVVSSAIPDNSSAWTDNGVGWRLILDDGVHRVELALSRDPGTKAREVRLQDAAGAPEIPFPWDNDFPNRYEITRLATGDFVVTLTNGDPNAPNRVVTQPYTAAQTAATSSLGIPQFAWGMGLVGGGTTFWQEVHAETVGADFPIGLTVRQLRIRDDNHDRLRLRASFTLGQGSDGIDPVTEPVTLTFSTPAGLFYPEAGSAVFPIEPGEFELRDDHGLRSWRLTHAARQRTGIERFDILEEHGSILFVDRRTNLPVQAYDHVTVELIIGNDRGTAQASLIEKPPGSGRWRADR